VQRPQPALDREDLTNYVNEIATAVVELIEQSQRFILEKRVRRRESAAIRMEELLPLEPAARPPATSIAESLFAQLLSYFAGLSSPVRIAFEPRPPVGYDVASAWVYSAESTRVALRAKPEWSAYGPGELKLLMLLHLLE
jgi:hypothetical protein